MSLEIWKNIPGYEGFYQVSTLGRVRSLPRTIVYSNNKVQRYEEYILKPFLSSRGYPTINLSINRKMRWANIHRLMGESFLNIPNDKQINHINGVKTDNRLENLEVCSCLENIQHAYKTGLNKNIGQTHHQAKLTGKNVLKIRELIIQKEMTKVGIAKLFNISPTTVGDIDKRRIWKHI